MIVALDELPEVPPRSLNSVLNRSNAERIDAAVSLRNRMKYKLLGLASSASDAPAVSGRCSSRFSESCSVDTTSVNAETVLARVFGCDWTLSVRVRKATLASKKGRESEETGWASAAPAALRLGSMPMLINRGGWSRGLVY